MENPLSQSHARPQEPPRVRDVMTRSPLTVTPRTHLAEAVTLMEAKGVRHLPVLEGRRLVGLLSERHVRDALPSVLTLQDPEARRRFLAATRVSQVWIQNPSTIHPDAPLIDAITRMRRLRAGSLPVVAATELVGILTSADLINAFDRVLRRLSTRSG